MKLMNCVPLIALLLVGCSTSTIQTKPAGIGTGPLHKIISNTDHIVVFEDPTPGAKVLFESRDRHDIEALAQSLKLGEPPGVHCMCVGSPEICLYVGDKEIGSFTNHHAMLIRSALWKSDVPIVDQEAFLKWFDDRGMSGPRQEVNYQREESRQGEIALKRWEENMPLSIRPIWRKLNPIMPDRMVPTKTLAAQIPDRSERIMALFAWFGSGRGPWSGFPSYEMLAEEMLLDYATTDLLTAIDSRQGDLSDREIEGVARLFAGWDFSQKKKGEIKLLPNPLRARLLSHSLASADQTKSSGRDKIGRAQRAFCSTE
jgi:hypothetical protein